MPRSELYVRSIPLLEWYYRDSGAELGLRGTDPRELSMPRSTAPASTVDTSRAQRAARQQSEVRAVLRALDPVQRAAIALAYERCHVVAAPEVVSRYGRAAGLVLMALRGRREAPESRERVRAACEALRHAQERFELERRARRDARARELRAARDAGHARNEQRLAVELGKRAAARTRAAAWLEGLGDGAEQELRRMARGAGDA